MRSRRKPEGAIPRDRRYVLTLEPHQSSISSRNASPDIETSMVSISKTGNVIRRARFPHFGQGSPGLA